MNELQISPTELKFPFELKKQIPAILRLTNTCNSYVAFKVKTTSPKKYCVKPNTGVVPPRSVTEVQVIMQAQREWPADLSNCRDKFLVQSAVLDAEPPSGEVTAEMFSKTGPNGNTVRELKLRVMYIASSQPPPSVPESDELGADAPGFNEKLGETGEGAKVAELVSSLSAVTEERNRLKNEQARLRNELQALKDSFDTKLAEAVRSSKAVSTTVGTVAKSKASTGMTFAIYHLLLVAILSFLIGRLV
eukprot:jgi/Mesvir1/28729/Mv19697-RA.1